MAHSFDDRTFDGVAGLLALGEKQGARANGALQHRADQSQGPVQAPTLIDKLDADVAQEPVLRPMDYGTDRLFVYLKLKGEKNDDLNRQVRALLQAQHPVLQLDLHDRYDLAGEFFRGFCGRNLRR